MIGVLCIHGFTGSPREIDPLVQYLKKNTNWIVKAPTLPGHGEPLKLKGIGYEHWLHFAEEELKQLLDRCEKIYVCGYSMGGMISSWLTARYPIDRLVLLSASAFYINPKLFYKNLFSFVVNGWKPSCKERQILLAYKRKIRATPLSAYMQFRKLVKQIRPAVKEVQVPTLIVQGRRDSIVPEKSAHYLYKHICTRDKKLLMIDEANHLICYGDHNHFLFQEIMQFLEGKTNF
ncbi:alpha/beta hydrolase [Fervidibacillus halotolerans]|uniref:Alpha/beta fold hydrolase n=1 Tax=Fervidibacillus halotolerans TaxID=2980027 RepID=A0A9E8RX97_9BACI|nr:alpha/beta fold hydrolase [Fervidibacillus halotolerans]WAA12555.1 alpha/beta fold hydrolase [Fervidibacillus halotolerans]